MLGEGQARPLPRTFLLHTRPLGPCVAWPQPPGSLQHPHREADTREADSSKAWTCSAWHGQAKCSSCCVSKRHVLPEGWGPRTLLCPFTLGSHAAAY